jgi:hypothetical protein
MKARIELTSLQCREVNNRIKKSFVTGYNNGCESALLFSLSALHNLYDWKSAPMQKFLNEVLNIANAAGKDPDMVDRMKLKMSDLGIEIQGQFYTLPREE